MRSIVCACALLAFVSASSSFARAADPVHRDIDAAKSRAQFSVEHIYVETVTGTVPVLAGTVDLAPGSLIPSSVSATLDPTKIKTGEDDRDGALQSPDWFDTKKFPTWSFASTKVVPKSTREFELDGLVTIHGVAVPERFDAVVSGDAAHPVYRATGTIDRHAFGMAKTRLDPIVGGEVSVTLLVALK